MNFNQYTIKAQEAVQNAQQYASSMEHASIETAHLLYGILKADEQVADYLLKKMGSNPSVLQSRLAQIFERLPKVSGDADQYLSRQANKALMAAQSSLKEFGDEFVSIELMLLGLLEAGDETSELLKDSGVNAKDLKAAILELRKGNTVTAQNAESTYNSLEKYAINLNERASSGKLDPVIGRDEEIRRVLHILSRRTKNNPILVGEPGVGKTAIAEGIAHRIVNGDVPENLKSKIFYSLDMGALIAGAKYKGEFEERLKAVVKEVIQSDGQIVLFIDEIHTLIGAGASEGAMDAANILKPALARGELRAVGATTLNEYQKYFEKDKALERRFQKVFVDEPSPEDAISILRGLKERYETHHKVGIRDEAIVSAVQLSSRYIVDRFLPDKAIDLIDEAAAKLRLEMDSVPEELDEIERKLRQYEIERVAIKRENDKEKLGELSRLIADLSEQRDSLKAQWQAEKELVDQVQARKEEIEQAKMEAEQAEREGDFGRVAELRYGKIGQTREALQLLEKKMKDLDASNRLMKEEVDSEDIAEIISKWTGIPVSKMIESEREKLLHLEDRLHKRVIGQDEAIEAVSDAIRRSRAGLQDPQKPIGSFIFLGTTGVGKTELAKALAELLFNDEHMMTRIDMSEYQERHSVSRLVGAPPGYVGYEEGGQLTEAVRRRPYSVILLDEIEKAHPDVFNILLQLLDDGRLTDNKGRTVNFKNTIIIMTSNIGSHLIQEAFEGVGEMQLEGAAITARMQVMDLLKKSLRPEFLNRVDEIIVFKPLMPSEIEKIVQIQLQGLKKMLESRHIHMSFTEQAVSLLGKAGFDPQFGARPLKRLIQRKVVNELSRKILSSEIGEKSSVLVDAENENIVLRKIESHLDEQQSQLQLNGH